jgi:hypothetical protein
VVVEALVEDTRVDKKQICGRGRGGERLMENPLNLGKN